MIPFMFGIVLKTFSTRVHSALTFSEHAVPVPPISEKFLEHLLCSKMTCFQVTSIDQGCTFILRRTSLVQTFVDKILQFLCWSHICGEDFRFLFLNSEIQTTTKSVFKNHRNSRPMDNGHV